MPRRYRDEEDEYEGYDLPEDTVQEAEDVRVALGIPTLREIRLHIMEHAWNGGECLPSMSNESVFKGQCEYASTAMSEMLTGTGKNSDKAVDWSLRVRGWFKGDLSLIMNHISCDSHAFVEGDRKHCHSWVEYKGKIYDPTFWQFAGDEVKVYVFELNDPRFVRDDDAEGELD
jgi:hypothetical protein